MVVGDFAAIDDLLHRDGESGSSTANALPLSVTNPGREAAISSVKNRLSVRG